MKKLIWKIAIPPKFEKVPERAGIYIISTNQKEDMEYEVKFVGQAENLRVRVNEHWSKNEKNEELKAHIAEKYMMKFNYSEVDSRTDRDGMVLYLHKLYDPPFNTGNLPEADIIKCTVPAVRKHL